ncbi:MAG: diguanylate cyclase, partial [Desulfobacterales bacterium]
QIVNKLKGKDIDVDVLSAVEERLQKRLEACIDKLNTAALLNTDVTPGLMDITGHKTVLQIMEESAEEGDELQTILQQVRESLRARGIDENNFQQIYDEIARIKAEQQKRKKREQLPEGILSRRHTQYFLGKEIARAIRYYTALSVITFWIVKVKPLESVPAGGISGDEIKKAVIAALARVLRGADIVGILGKKAMIAILPMTEEKEAQIAMRRILKSLNSEPFLVKDIALSLQFAANVTVFDRELTPDLESFIETAQSEINDLVLRLTNIQELL